MQVYLNQRQYKILEILSHQEECITSLEISKIIHQFKNCTK